MPASADTIYSNLPDTTITADFDGTTVTIDGGTLNPFLGGVCVANNGQRQPFRAGAGNLDTRLNFSQGAHLGARTLNLSTGCGGWMVF